MGIKIPTITLSVRTATDEGTCELNGNAVGLGLLVMGLLSLLYGNTAGLGPEGLTAFCCAFGGAIALCALLGAAFDKPFHGLFRTLGPVVASSAGCVAGCLGLLGAAALSGVPQAIAAAACGVTIGSGTGLLVFYWGISFGRTDTPNIVFNASISTAIAILLYALVVEQLPSPLGHLIVSAAPFLNVLFLRERVTNNLPNADMREATYFSELNIARGSFAAKIIPALACLGFVLALLVAHAGFSLTPAAGPAGIGFTVLAMVLSCAIVLVSSAHSSQGDQSFNHTFRLMMPIVALFILPLPFTGVSETSLGNMLILTAMAMCITLGWAFLANVCQEFRLSPVHVFGLGTGAVACGMLLALLATRIIPTFVGNVMSNTAMGLMLCLFGLVVVCGLFPRRDDIRAIVVKSFAPEQLWGAEEEAASDGQAEALVAEGPRAGGAAGAGAAGAGAGAGSAAEPDAEADANRKGRFMRRCDQVADTYLLSRRETDVLYLLAKGRNVGYIKEKLYISEGTAKTHVHHVYKKLNVHSQQELMALIDSVEA